MYNSIINNCIPANNAEELYINDFLHFYNYEFKENFRIKYSPEKEFRNSYQPEFILNDGKQNIAIERKIICFPEQLIHQHTLFHNLSDILHNNLLSYFTNNLYYFSIKYKDIPSKKLDLIKFTENITKVILTEKHLLNEDVIIVSDFKPRWEFGIVPLIEREEYEPQTGINVVASDIYEFQNKKLNIKNLNNYLKTKLNIVNLKFSNYKDIKTIFLVQTIHSIHKKTILDYLKKIYKTFDNISEVWVAEEIYPEYETPFFSYYKL